MHDTQIHRSLKKQTKSHATKTLKGKSIYSSKLNYKNTIFGAENRDILREKLNPDQEGSEVKFVLNREDERLQENFKKMC